MSVPDLVGTPDDVLPEWERCVYSSGICSCGLCGQRLRGRQAIAGRNRTNEMSTETMTTGGSYM